MSSHDADGAKQDHQGPETEPDGGVESARDPFARKVVIEPGLQHDQVARAEEIEREEMRRFDDALERAVEASGYKGVLPIKFDKTKGPKLTAEWPPDPFDLTDEEVDRFCEAAKIEGADTFDMGSDTPQDRMYESFRGLGRVFNDAAAHRRIEESAAFKRRYPHVSRLDRADLELLRAATGPRPVAGPRSVDEADELWAAMHAEAPWLASASTEAWRCMRGALAAGQGPLIPPLLLHGPPGNGKTTFGRTLARLMGVPLLEIDVGSGASAFPVAGLEAGWSGSKPGLPVQTLLAEPFANPVVVVNELCRAGDGATGTSGVRTSIVDALLPLLDRASARRYRCPSLRVLLDTSAVTWILTANDISDLSSPLLSRVFKVQTPRPDPSQVAEIVRRRLNDLDEDLAERIASVVARQWRCQRSTLRQLDAMIGRVRRSLSGPRLH